MATYVGIGTSSTEAEAEIIAVASAQNFAYGALGTNNIEFSNYFKVVRDNNDGTVTVEIELDAQSVNLPPAVPPSSNATPAAPAAPENLNLGANNPTAAQTAANQQTVLTALAQKQTVLANQARQVNQTDWRIRLSLAPGAKYLYNDPNGPGILAPLYNTNGVVFPYTPKIDTSYKADYDPYNLTHSNYKGYFYKNSSVDAVTLSCTFTAQDSAEADYLLATIHFFKSVTKMFYGQDPQRGSPPPMVYLTGLGEYQFSKHPCVVSSFTYNLPNDVDYIRARSPNTNGVNLLTRRNTSDLPSNVVTNAIKRLQTAFSGQKVPFGAESNPPAPNTLGLNSPTYVPTKIDITITLLPMQSRQQVSQLFSLKKFANGDGLKGGFW